MKALYFTIGACLIGLGYCFGCYRMLAKQRDGRLISERDHENTVREVVKNLKQEERLWQTVN
jgi:hypothetical protein